MGLTHWCPSSSIATPHVHAGQAQSCDSVEPAPVASEMPVNHRRIKHLGGCVCLHNALWKHTALVLYSARGVASCSHDIPGGRRLHRTPGMPWFPRAAPGAIRSSALATSSTSRSCARSCHPGCVCGPSCSRLHSSRYLCSEYPLPNCQRALQQRSFQNDPAPCAVNARGCI